MARITVEDCLSRIPNRFLLVNMVAKRVRQIREGSEYLVNSPKNEDVVVALREVAAGKISIREETPKIEPVEGTDEAEAEAAEAAEEVVNEAGEAGAVEAIGEAEEAEDGEQAEGEQDN